MNLRNLASLAAEVKEVGYSWMARGPLNTGPSVRCRSQQLRRLLLPAAPGCDPRGTLCGVIFGVAHGESGRLVGSVSSPDAFVEVCMTTIDPGTEASDLKKMLFNLSQEHEMVTAEPLRCPLHHPPPSSSSSSTTLPSVEPSGESSRAQRADVPAPLPSICMPRARFAAHMERLLDTHSGSLPLDSFQWCYEAEFGPLPLAPDLEPWREGCVPLEHLVASLPGVTVVTSAQGFKRAVRDSLEDPLPNGEYTSIVPSIALCLGLHAVLKHRTSRLLTLKLKKLSGEVVELLYQQEQCSLPLQQFIPAFHRHFGRTCWLADYRCTRLVDLLAAIGHVVEILGQGSTRVVTLTHEVQLERFVVDVKAVLEDPGSPQALLLSSLPQRYQDVHRRPLRVADYGVCCLDDLLHTLPRSMVLVGSPPARGLSCSQPPTSWLRDPKSSPSILPAA
ncbi:hypothetical protein HPB48_017475 [Haemaphysalis longicornis]|uniref:HTH OST-type domain-containing protein n=1 Tax=Haemaphysalis longicornis TaxID=44386 RepID=A0A9J6FG97_HAELO|nr:hypothetical protein HPB48_017475 [Haemaphysalis longicornis]